MYELIVLRLDKRKGHFEHWKMFCKTLMRGPLLWKCKQNISKLIEFWHFYQTFDKTHQKCQQNGKDAVFDTADGWRILAYYPWDTFNRFWNIVSPAATGLSSSSILNKKSVNHEGWNTYMHSNFSIVLRCKVYVTRRHYAIFLSPSPSLSLTSLRLLLWYCM